MKKRDLVMMLLGYLNAEKFSMKGEKIFFEFFLDWLQRLHIPSDEKYDFYEIRSYIPQLLGDAWEAMRLGTNGSAGVCRSRYEEELCEPMIGLIDLGEGDILRQSMSIRMLGHALEVMTKDKWIQSNVESYFSGQTRTLQAEFDKFLRVVYRNGLYEIIQSDSSRGMQGTFGSTHLRTFVCAGRLMFTFARPKKKASEVSVSFLAADDDPLALSAGIHSVHANLPTALSMIEDVIRRWPSTTEKQKTVFKGACVTPFPGLMNQDASGVENAASTS